MTTFSELKEVGETLGRFASVREKADSPQDRIAIQANKGKLKMIAGDYEKTVIATIGPTEDNGMAIVSSRLLLTTLKSMKGKGEVSVIVTDKGAEFRTGFGSTIELENITSELPYYLRPKPFGNGPTARFEEGWLPLASRYLGIAIGEFAPFNQVYAHTTEDGLWFRASDNHIGTECGSIDSDGFIDAHFPAGLFASLKGLEDAGGFYFPERTDSQSPQAQIGAGKYRVVTVLRPGVGKLPFLPKMVYNVTITADKKELQSAFKSLVGRQEFNKVILAADDKVTISGSQVGKVEVQAMIEGNGKIAVDASLMTKIIQTVEGRNITVEYSNKGASLVRVSGDKHTAWRINLAPMKV